MKNGRIYSKPEVIPILLVILSSITVSGLNAQDFSKSEDREKLYNNACRTCHVLKEGVHRLGPSLFGVVGRKAGSISGYKFSPALSDSGLVWDESTLDKFIANPDSVAPGNNMKPYTALTSSEHRAAIITFLKEKSAR